MDRDSAGKIDPSSYIWRPAGTLDPIFRPRSVAVIGATETPNSVGLALMRNLCDGSFKGEVFPVHPSRPSVLGRRAWRDAAALPSVPDLAVIATPAATVPGIIRTCAALGVRGGIVISAGFKERGAEGEALERAVLDAARGRMRIIGPNCLGVMNPSLGFNATFAQSPALPGSVAFISQSGALMTAILDWSLRERFGFSAFVSAGSMLDVGWGDLIDHLASDAATRAILIYMESIGDAKSFLSAAREAALVKPIIVLKSGRSAQAAKAARSHTGALSGADAALDAAFRRCGVLRVDSVSELFEMADVLSKQPSPKGPRLAIVTNAGGPGVLATDALVAQGGDPAALSDETIRALDAVLPAHWSRGNPVDILGDAGPERYARALEIVASDPGIDGLLAVLTPQAMTDPLATAAALAAMPRASKPVLAAWMGGEALSEARQRLREARIPVFDYPDQAARTFESMWRHTSSLTSLYETPFAAAAGAGDAQAAAVLDRAAAEKREILTEEESKRVLASHGIRCVETLAASTADEAAACAKRVGYPAVLKLLSKTITHKTDAGGVRLDLRDEAAVREAFEAIRSGATRAGGAAAFDGVTVQPMIDRSGGFELMIGSSPDADLGPILLFGAGGVLAEILNDCSLGLPPLNTTLALRMMERTRIFAALGGARGRKPVPIRALQEFLVRFSELVIAHPRIREIDVNPALASGDGVVALDARVILHPAGSDPASWAKPPIRPYPAAYVWDFGLKGEPASSVRIRPIRPEDETLLREFHHRLSENTVHQRYFHAIGLEERIAHERLSKICFNDYDREIALVAETAGTGGPSVIGVGRLSRDRRSRDAEFAVVVADAYQRRGLGREILKRIVDVARAERCTAVWARVLPENRAMLRLCASEGFAEEWAEEGAVCEVRKDLIRESSRAPRGS